MSAIKSLIDAGIAAQSAALLGENWKVAKYSLGSKRIKARNGANLKKIVGLGVTNIVGINLLRTQAQLTERL